MSKDEETEKTNCAEPEDSLSSPMPTPSELAAKAQVPSRRLALKPFRGMVFNPLRTLPRNMLCPCRSGHKFKRCCLNNLPMVVTEANAENFKRQMAKSDLVFLTNDNRDKIQAEVTAIESEAATPVH